MRFEIGRVSGGGYVVTTRNTKIEDVCQVDYVDELKVQSARRLAKSPEMVSMFAETFRLLGDPTRVRIAHALACEELCVCDLANLLGLSQSVVSHSLRSLRQMKLVRYRKQGKIAYYALDDHHIRQLLEIGFEHVDEITREQFKRVEDPRAGLPEAPASGPSPQPSVARRRPARS